MTISSGRLLCLAALAAGAIVAGCGSGSNKPSASGSASSKTANAADKAFLSEIIPNDELAVAYSKLAQTHATHMQLKVMAGHIITADTPQIAQLTALAKTMGITVDAMQPTSMTLMTNNTAALGITSMSLIMDSVSVSSVASAKPFDKIYIGNMQFVQEAARILSQDELSKGTSTQLHSVASGALTDAGTAVTQLNSWNSMWYGKTASTKGTKGMKGMKGTSGMSGMSGMGKKSGKKKSSSRMSGMG